MEIAYQMIGLRVKTDGTLANLNEKLKPYNLVADKECDEIPASVRRLSDAVGFERYNIFHSSGDDPDSARDYCLGILLGNTGYGSGDVVETDLSDLESAVNTIRADIPDAKSLTFSHWV